jgi:hypothetical protein
VIPPPEKNAGGGIIFSGLCPFLSAAGISHAIDSAFSIKSLD